MFSDDKKKKGISISPLNFVQGPDGSLNVTDVHTEEDFARALKLFELNSKRIQSTQRIARNAPDSLENGSRLPNLTEEEKNARNAEKMQLLEHIGPVESTEPEKSIQEVVELYERLRQSENPKTLTEKLSVIRSFFEFSKVVRITW